MAKKVRATRRGEDRLATLLDDDAFLCCLAGVCCPPLSARQRAAFDRFMAALGCRVATRRDVTARLSALAKTRA